MVFKKKDWIPYGKRAKFIEINVKNNQNQTIDFFKIYHNKSDLEKNERNDNPKRVLKILKQKYNFDFEEEKNKFLKKDMNW
jgi:hypothetical protein